MQAARGTSLSDDDTTTPHRLASHGRGTAGWSRRSRSRRTSSTSPPSSSPVTRLADGDVPILGDWFVLHLTRNPGAAFSTGTDFTCLPEPAWRSPRCCVVLWFARRVGDLVVGGRLSGCCSAASLGNLTDRLFRDPGPLRGHVVDLFMVPNWPVFNVADICINVAAAADRAPDVPRASRSTATAPGTTGEPGRPPHALVPEGLDGERVDAALARLFGLSRTRAAELIAEGHVRVDGRPCAKSHRVEHGLGARGQHPGAGRPACRSSPRSSRGSRSSTTTTPSS